MVFLIFFFNFVRKFDELVNLPEDFIRETGLVMGEERMNRFLGAFDEEAPTSIRLNPRKISLTPHPSPLTTNMVPWCQEGFYLQGRPQFTFDPLFHAGCYYVQEAASMFVTHILRTLLTPHASLSALDMCAAPGGKSTALRTVLPEGSLLVCNEPIANRAQILLENITKWGWSDCIVTNNYPRDFRKAKATFDLILCDVPCSGEGMFRRDPATIGEWSLQNVEKCWRLQREIVADAWECLNPGGLFIYSTCTFNIIENEANVQWLTENLEAEMLGVDTEERWAITGSLLTGFSQPVYRFIPGITRSEGLFMAVMRKPSATGQRNNRQNDGRRKLQSALKDGALNVVTNLVSPTPPDSVATVDLNYAMAISYLRGEAIVLPTDVPRGPVSVTFKGRVLGQAKNIGSRANNLYPKEWRIKSTHVPSEYQASVIVTK